MSERGGSRHGSRRAVGPLRVDLSGPGRRRAAAGPRPTPRVPGEGRAARRRAAKRIQRRRRLRATREIPILIGVALLIALLLKTFLVQAFVIPTGSMEETIRIQDRVLVDKFTPWFGWQPSRGDVVVFQDPGSWLAGESGSESDGGPIVVKQVREALTWMGLLPSANDRDLIKRVIGVGGDTVACCDKSGRVTVNGAPLDEPYLYPGNAPSEIEFEVTVPEGRLFVMGDHRGNSADSRYHLKDAGQGTVPEERVVGRAMVIAWPLKHWSRLGAGDAFAAVPEPGGTVAAARMTSRENDIALVPIPAELPVVMGVVSLLRTSHRPERGVRSECGGCGSRCTVRRGGAGGPSGDPGRCRTRRRASRRRGQA